jgi:hypothetical protein
LERVIGRVKINIGKNVPERLKAHTSKSEDNLSLPGAWALPALTFEAKLPKGGFLLPDKSKTTPMSNPNPGGFLYF